MMESYRDLARSYDALTQDVGYEKRADFIEKLFCRAKMPVKTVLDLACGTGSMSAILMQRGYEMIAADASEDMLAAAREKTAALSGEPPVFLHQSMPKLDLYGTVDAAICCLDSLNYLTAPRDVRKTFERLRLFVAPGGVLVFDVLTPARIASLDGQVFFDESEDLYCTWRAFYSARSRTVTYYMDIFRRMKGDLWQRSEEVHRERAYTVEELTRYLTEAGFTAIKTHGDCTLSPARENAQRVYFSCIRGK